MKSGYTRRNTSTRKTMIVLAAPLGKTVMKATKSVKNLGQGPFSRERSPLRLEMWHILFWPPSHPFSPNTCCHHLQVLTPKIVFCSIITQFDTGFQYISTTRHTTIIPFD